MNDDEQNDEQGLRKYTRDEAEALLPELRDVLTHMREIWISAGAERQAFEQAQESKDGPVPVSQAHQHLVSALWDVHPLVAWLRSRDIVLRDPETGLVDFLAEIQGEDGYLCWRLGEDDIRFWHGTDEGFDNRKPLPEA